MNERDAERKRILDEAAQQVRNRWTCEFPGPWTEAELQRMSRRERRSEILLFTILWTVVIGAVLALLIWG